MKKTVTSIKADETMLFNLAELFKVFGDSTRVKILHSLLNTELSVTEIAQKLMMTQPAISQQLRVLKSSGLVKFRREGKLVMYSLADEHVSLILNIGIEHLSE
ncbi:metalloregulator ArsR/SmtB family transcription factor [Treponema sp.]|uniref:ArsR/SmtB family transcription factor n=1 Tax=Treponema sp. TaxID=166 RepID=UPI0025EC38FB|nr:metalloregulator ArsR/SmtB family transcription factor [Treponema sp.]MCR5218392.1 metalloregulator ArsR/SmtB family transcription factor [Treponema sp.]